MRARAQRAAMQLVMLSRAWTYPRPERGPVEGGNTKEGSHCSFENKTLLSELTLPACCMTDRRYSCAGGQLFLSPAA